MTNDELQSLLRAYKAEVDQALDRYLPSQGETPRRLHEAMRYSVMAGGKRVRPILTLMAADACEHGRSIVMPYACAYECVHVYSLIHDDLPAMDNADLRRGKKTCHKEFGEATAILAGDGLLTFAFELLCAGEASDDQRGRLALDLATYAGCRGMVGGQMLDIAAEGAGERLEDAEAREQLQQIHAWKTASLITGAVRAGAIAAGGTEVQVTALTQYGRSIGLAFQVADDILDATETTEHLGKDAGADRERGKLTYVSCYGIEAAKNEASRLRDQALKALSSFGDVADPLRAMAEFIVARTH